MSNIKQLSSAIRVALLAGAASLVALPAVAQEGQPPQNDEARVLDRVEVVGTRIARANIEGALPVTVIDRSQIELSGETSVADLLRSTTFNSFGSFRPQSGSAAQSFAELSLRGLGGARTLILIDGRRAPIAPNAGQGQDLNSIPLAAVERIEILTDGASAIYGSDAIGGVVNIITRRDFSGAEISFGMGNPIREGGETEEGSAIIGIAGESGNAIVGASFNNRGIIFQRDREWSRGGTSTFSNNLFVAIPAPGTLYGFRPGGFLANPTWGSRVPGFACNADGFFVGGTGAAQRCFYDFTFVAADEAEIRNSSLFARGNYNINDDWSLYFNANVSRVRSFGRYAPVPSSPWPGGGIFIPVGSPNHPAVRFPGAGYNPAAPVFLRHRFAAAGNRDVNTDANTYSLDLGVDGRIGEFDVNFGMRRVDSQYYEIGRGYILASSAQEAIASGRYDIYNPFANPRDLLNSFTVTTGRDSRFLINEFYASASTDLFELAGGTAAIAFGGEMRTEEFQDLYDSLSEAGVVSGSAGNSAAGERDMRAAFVEVLLPVIEDVEVTVAARHDRYSDFGSATSPQLSVRYSALDNLTLRASVGQGFRAPTLDILHQKASFSADSVTDAATCAAFGLPPTCSTQIEAWVIANPNLDAETSDQWSTGVAWDPTDWLSLTADYWSIKVNDRVAAISSGTIIGCLGGTTANCPPGLSNLSPALTPPVPGQGLGMARAPGTGEILYIQRGFANLGTIEADGVDLNVRTEFDFADWGNLRNQLQVSWNRSFTVDGGDNIINEPAVPRFRAQLQNAWDVADFTFAWNVNYIHKTSSTASNQIPPNLNFPQELPSWTTHDVQATWNTPWNGELTFGVNNVADKDPVLDPFDPTGRGFEFALYDGYGRVPFIRYTQRF